MVTEKEIIKDVTLDHYKKVLENRTIKQSVMMNTRTLTEISQTALLEGIREEKIGIIYLVLKGNQILWFFLKINLLLKKDHCV